MFPQISLAVAVVITHIFYVVVFSKSRRSNCFQRAPGRRGISRLARFVEHFQGWIDAEAGAREAGMKNLAEQLFGAGDTARPNRASPWQRFEKSGATLRDRPRRGSSTDRPTFEGGRVTNREETQASPSRWPPRVCGPSAAVTSASGYIGFEQRRRFHVIGRTSLSCGNRTAAETPLHFCSDRFLQ
jgi:hypothetical protein